MLDPTRLSDHIRLDTHNHINTYGARNYGLRARKAAENRVNLEESGFVTNDDGEDEGACTPPLWRSNSPPTSPSHRHHHFRSLSPSSRTQAIARGQREMMEMVSKLPEGCYELSLKDLVEHPILLQARQQESTIAESFSKERNNEKNEKRIVKRKVKVNRNGSVNNGGLLLKMVFPVTWGSGNKKKMNRNNSNCNTGGVKDGRVSPKPLLFEGGGKSADEEWWKNRYSVSGESESGGFSSNSRSSKSSGSSSSRSSSRNSTRRTRGGCCTFIFSSRSKRHE